MLKRKIQQNWKKNKRVYILTGGLLVTGILIGVKMQRKIDTKAFKKALDGVLVLEKVANPMFPDIMTIAEIKEVLSNIDGAEFFDALVTRVNGTESIIIR